MAPLRSMSCPPRVGCSPPETLAGRFDPLNRTSGHRSREGAARRRADPDSGHGGHGAVAAAPPDGRQPADALVASGRASDAQGPHRRREWHARPRPCRRRAVGPPTIPPRRLTPPGFWTVSPRLSMGSQRFPLRWPFRTASRSPGRVGGVSTPAGDEPTTRSGARKPLIHPGIGRMWQPGVTCYNGALPQASGRRHN